MMGDTYYSLDMGLSKLVALKQKQTLIRTQKKNKTKIATFQKKTVYCCQN